MKEVVPLAKRFMMKSFSIVLLLVLVLSFSFQVFASPDTLPGNVTSTATGLVTLKSPEYATSSTTNKKLPISVTAPEGSTVTVYKYNYSTGLYHKVWIEEAPLEATVGATTLFAAQVDLTKGQNKFLVRGAWDDASYSVVKFEVNVLNEGFMDRIKGVISAIFN